MTFKQTEMRQAVAIVLAGARGGCERVPVRVERTSYPIPSPMRSYGIGERSSAAPDHKPRATIAIVWRSE